MGTNGIAFSPLMFNQFVVRCDLVYRHKSRKHFLQTAFLLWQITLLPPCTLSIILPTFSYLRRKQKKTRKLQFYIYPLQEPPYHIWSKFQNRSNVHNILSYFLPDKIENKDNKNAVAYKYLSSQLVRRAVNKLSHVSSYDWVITGLVISKLAWIIDHKS